MLSLLFATAPKCQENPTSKIRERVRGELDAKTGEHLRQPTRRFHSTRRRRPVTINPRRTVEIDTMLDRAEIVVDNDQRPAQRRQLARIARLGHLQAGLRSRASRIARNLRLIESLWRYGIGGNLARFGCNLTRSAYLTLDCK